LYYLTITIFFSFLISFDCDTSESDPASTESSLVGTWELAQVVETISGVAVTLTPEEAEMDITLTFNNNNCCTGQISDWDGDWNLEGTWSATATQLTISWGGETPESVPYTLSGNTLTIHTEYDDIDLGVHVLQDLVFTRS